MAFLKRRISLTIIFLTICVISFQIGIRYEQTRRHRQEIVSYLNYLGSEINTVNETLDLLEGQTLGKVRKEYNSQALSDIGCYPGLKYITDFDHQKLHSFYHGVGWAIESADMNENPGVNPCATIIINMYLKHKMLSEQNQ